MRSFAEVAAQALDRATLYASEVSARAQLEIVAALSGALIGASNVSEVAEIVVERAMRGWRADTCMLYVIDESDGALALLAERGCAPEVTEAIRRHAPTSVTGARLLREVWVESAEEYARGFPETASIASAHRRAAAFWSMPLHVEGRMNGVLAMGFYEPRAFPAGEREVVRAFARHCAQALRRAERLASEQQARRARGRRGARDDAPQHRRRGDRDRRARAARADEARRRVAHRLDARRSARRSRARRPRS